MSISPKTCKISKGTTLKELAAYLNLTPEQLKRYHNANCPLQDLIGYEIPDHVTIIYVPPKEQELRDKIFSSEGAQKIKYKSKNLLDNGFSYNKRYGIIQKTFLNNSETNKIHYEVEVKKQQSLFEINRHAVYINNQEPDLIVEQMADKMGSIIYPLKIKTGETGEIREVTNQQDILDRWLKLRPDLEEYYVGYVAKNIFDKAQKRLQSRSRFLNDIKKPIFHQLYFLPLWNKLDEEGNHSFEQTLYLDKQSPFHYKIDIKLEKEISPTNKVFINATGSLDSESYPDIDTFRKTKEQRGFFDFTYKLNAMDNSIFSIVGEMGVKSFDENKKIIFECYELS